MRDTPTSSDNRATRDRTDRGAPWSERRAVAVVALLALGYALAEAGVMATAPSWVFLAGGAVAAVSGLFRRGLWCRIVLSVAVVLLGCGWFRARCDEPPSDALARILIESPALIRVAGVALETPVYDPPEPDPLDPAARRASSPWRFEFRADAVVDADGGRTPVSGTLRARSSFLPAGVRPGSRLMVRGFARGPTPAMNPGEPDRARLARQSGVAGSIHVPAEGFIEPDHHEPGQLGAWRDRWRACSERLRAASHGALTTAHASSGAPRDEAVALLRAMLLGHRDDDLRDLSESFTRVGLAHVLCVSGMNLTLLSVFAAYAVRLIGDRPRLEKTAVGLLVVAYLIVVPAEAPIVRAALMIGVFLIAEWGGRRYDRINTLAWAAAISLIWRPMDLWSPGFQLSYVGVASLLLLVLPLREKLFGPTPEDDALGRGLRGLILRGLELLKSAFAVTFCTWIAVSPLVLYHTGLVSPIGPLANLLVWPLVAVITGAGYALVLVGTLVPAATAWATPGLHGVAESLAWLVRLLDHAPGSAVTLPRVSALWCVAATALAAWWALKPTPPITPHRERIRRRWLTAGMTAALLLWLLGEIRFRPGIPTDEVEIAVLHVPGGSCTVIRSGREAVLYDAGAEWPGAGARLIPRALRAMGVASVRTALVSHADPARFNALPDLVRPLGVREVLVPEQFLRLVRDTPDSAAAQLVRTLDELGVHVRAVARGDRVMIGSASARVLAPSPGELMQVHRDASLVLAVGMPARAADRDGASDMQAAVLLGDVGREGFESLHGRVPSLPSRIVVPPRAGWAAQRTDEIARWASDGRSSPVIIVPEAQDITFPASVARAYGTGGAGCVRVRLRADGDPEITPFRAPRAPERSFETPRRLVASARPCPCP